MEKFEDIITYGYIDHNKIIYNKLCKLLYKNEKDIVCYVGAGFSLYCNSWDKLFEEVYRSIPDEIKIANDKKLVWKEYIKDYTEENENIDYLKAANDIDDMLRNAESESNFNERVQAYLSFQIENYKEQFCESEWEFPIEPRAVFYLPFFMPEIPRYWRNSGKQMHKGRVLTTNLDNSIENAFDRYNYPMVQLPTIEKAKSADMNKKQCLVFYLHGYYLYLNSYVLTGRDYAKIYEESDKNKRFLKKYAFDSTAVLIFLGASLNNDAPLKTLKECFEQRDDESNDKRNFAFLAEKKEKIAKKYKDVLVNYNADSFFIPEKKFYCYAIIFCHMIREVKGKWWDTFLCNRGDKHDLYTKSAIKDDAMETFLKDSKIFSEKEHAFDVTLKQKLKDHLYFGQGPKYEWAVCWIDSEDFEFSQKGFSPLEYNLPLGNTIYLIHGVSDKKKTQYVKELERWCNDNQKVFDGGIKVRVIFQPRNEYFIYELDKFKEKNKGKPDIMMIIIDLIDTLENPLYHTERMFSFCEGVLSLLKGEVDTLIHQLYAEIKNEKNRIEQEILGKNDEQSQVESQTQNGNYQESVEANKAKARKLTNIHNFKQE